MHMNISFFPSFLHSFPLSLNVMINTGPLNTWTDYFILNIFIFKQTTWPMAQSNACITSWSSFCGFAGFTLFLKLMSIHNFCCLVYGISLHKLNIGKYVHVICKWFILMYALYMHRQSISISFWRESCNFLYAVGDRLYIPWVRSYI